MIKNRPLDHIGLAVTDVEAAAAWYQEVLGFYVKGKFKNGEDTVYFLASKDDGVIYEIYPDASLPEAAQGKVDHISYISTDIEADYDYCVKAGYNVCTNGIEGVPTFWEKGVRYFKILSATGEQVEFCQIL